MPILDWIGKDKVITHHQQVPYRVLEQQYSYGQPNSGNMIIHGDNLDALKSLLPRYEGKINCIYIDPPYNTGNEGWIYNDNVNDPKIKRWLGEVVGKEGEDLSRHDKWLCMMYPRLKLLQRLLSENGSIFISIDNNELFNLKQISDDIFGARNLIDVVVWQRTFATKNDARLFSSEHEYIVVYAKQVDRFSLRDLPRGEKQNSRYQNPDHDPRGLWISTDLLRMEHRDNSVYSITTPSGKVFTPKPGTSWRHPESEMLSLIQNNEVWFGKTGSSKPRRKRFLSDVRKTVKTQTIWKHDEVGHTQEAKQELKKILDASTDFFATPKPTRLVEHILQIASAPDSVILDSFAGSGTTAQAVLNLNKSDNGNRRFILIEMEDYADSITAERVKRVVDGYGEGKNSIEGTGGGFRYFELGDRLLLENGNLNESVDTAKIFEYIWYTETRSDYVPQPEKYLLGIHLNTAYYFHYEKERVTVLDHNFLHNIETKAGSYLVYADINALSVDELDSLNIRFKKIPRDIAKI